jgi:hypothetical protein
MLHLSSLLIPTLHGQIQWDRTVASVQTAILNPSCIPDNNGGFFVAWQDERGGRLTILAQHLDGRGNAFWNPSGVAVCSQPSGQSFPSVCEDGSGGIIVAWQDDRNADLDIYAQRIGPDGSPVWKPGGIALCDTVEDQSVPLLHWNGSDGAIAVWYDKRHALIGNLYAQKVSVSGATQWKSNGMAVTQLLSGNRVSHQVCGADSGGVFVAWRDDRADNSNIFIQKLASDGTAKWTQRGKAAAFSDRPQISPCLASSGTDAVVFWHEKRWSDADIFAQKMDPDGNALWGTEGITVNSAPGNQTNPVFIVDDGWIFAAWTDGRNGDSDIFMQYLDPSGYLAWAESGIAAVLEGGEQYNARLAPDRSGGVLVQWCDRRTGTDATLFAQRMDAEGVPQWAANGLAVSSSGGNQAENLFIPDRSGGAFSIWADQSATALCQGLLNDAVRFSHPGQYAFLPVATPVTLRWTQRVDIPDIASLRIRCAMYPDDPFSLLVAGAVSVRESEWTWQVPDAAASQARLKLEALDAYGNAVYFFLSDWFGIDATGPAAFSLIQPSNGTETNARPEFKWENASDPESGISRYRLMIDSGTFQDSIPEAFFQPSLAQKLPAGLHTWTVFAVNGAGMEAPASQTWSVRISTDETGPQAFHLQEPPDGSWSDGRNIRLKWEPALDPESGIWKYELHVDGQTIAPEIPAGQTGYTVALPTGNYAWLIRAVDKVGNIQDSEESWIIRVDQDPPASFNLLAPEDGAWTRQNHPVFQWTTSGDAGCGLNHYELAVNEVPILESIPPESLQISLPQGIRLADGIQYWAVQAVDLLGNKRRSEQAFRIRVDTRPPSEPVPLEPAPDSYCRTPTPDFRWRQSTDDGIGLSHYELVLDGLTIRTQLFDTLSSPVQALSAGKHAWALRAVDLLGNDLETPAVRFTADWSPPPAPLPLTPEANALTRRNRPRFSWQRAADASGIRSYELSIDGSRHILPGMDTSHVPSQALFNGPHVWHVQAIDSAGNRSASESRRFEVQAGSPQIRSAAQDTAFEDRPFAYTAEAIDPDGNELSIGFDHYASWLSPDGNILSGTPGKAGSASFIVFADNGTFQDSLQVWLVILETNDRPVILSDDTVTVTANRVMIYDAKVEDEDGPGLSVWFENVPGWLAVSGTRLSGTAPEDADGSLFLLIASDGLASDTLRVLIRVLSSGPGPGFDIPFPSLTVPAHESLRWQFSLDDQVSDPGFPDSVLSWTWAAFPLVSGLDVDIDEEDRTATLQILNVMQDIRIVFTVTNPLGMSVSDTLKISVGTAVQEAAAGIPGATAIFPPFPNPFNPALEFTVDLSERNEVTIDIYDAGGRHVAATASGPLGPGRHKLLWHADGYPAGLYLYQVRTASPALRRCGKALMLK